MCKFDIQYCLNITRMHLPSCKWFKNFQLRDVAPCFLWNEHLQIGLCHAPLIGNLVITQNLAASCLWMWHYMWMVLYIINHHVSDFCHHQKFDKDFVCKIFHPWKFSVFCYSCIMYLSDLTDMYTQARGPQSQGRGCRYHEGMWYNWYVPCRLLGN